MNTAREEEGDKFVTVDIDTEIRHGVNSGTNSKDIMHSLGGKSRTLTEVLNKPTMLLPQNEKNKSISEKNNIDRDCNEINVSDPKRRKMGHEDNSQDTEMVTSPNEENQNQKSFFW